MLTQCRGEGAQANSVVTCVGVASSAIAQHQQTGCLHTLNLTDADFQLLFGRME